MLKSTFSDGIKYLYDIAYIGTLLWCVLILFERMLLVLADRKDCINNKNKIE